jgi:NADPH2:quinone reductase
VNPADIFFRENGGYIKSRQPMVLGHDGAGVVEAVGPACDAIEPGDRVCFCHGGIGGPGTYAELAVVPMQYLARVPKSISMAQAAAMPLVSITAMEALRDRLRLVAGESILVHAGAGGTGHLAIQLAKWIGAKVATTISSPEKQVFVEALRADLAIKYREQDFVEAARRWTEEAGLDAAFDNVGGEVLSRTYSAMRPYGSIVTLMGSAEDCADVAYNANLSLHNEMMLTPMWLGITSRCVAQTEMVRQVLGLMDSGAVRVSIAAEFPLDNVNEAHALMENGGVIGKIVLSMTG